MMAALGIWLWGRPRSFAAADCNAVSTIILGIDVPFWSTALRITSLAIYSLFLTPGLNLIFPAFLFLMIFIVHRLCCPIADYGQNGVPPAPSIVPTITGMVILFALNIVFLTDTELTLHRHQLSGESIWSFGQILAMLLLVVPTRDILNSTLARGHTATLQEVVRNDAPTGEILRSVTQPGADVNTRVRGMDVGSFDNLLIKLNPSLDSRYTTVLHLAVSREDVTLVALLLQLEADPNIRTSSERGIIL
jgi:hypothetical protein